MGRKSTIYQNYKVVLCGGIMPKQSVEFSAGYDLYVPFDTVIKRGRQAVPIGIKMRLTSSSTTTTNHLSSRAAHE